MARSKSKTATTPEAQPPGAAEPPKRGKRGPKPFEPTPEMRSIVETALGYGLTQEEVCALVRNPATGRPIDPTTLRARFSDEIRNAEAVCHFEAAVSLRHLIRGRAARYDQAGNLLSEEIKIQPSAVYFYHKTRRGWREGIELMGKGGGPIETTHAKSELARRIARHASTDESEEAGEGDRVTH